MKFIITTPYPCGTNNWIQSKNTTNNFQAKIVRGIFWGYVRRVKASPPLCLCKQRQSYGKLRRHLSSYATLPRHRHPLPPSHSRRPHTPPAAAGSADDSKCLLPRRGGRQHNPPMFSPFPAFGGTGRKHRGIVYSTRERTHHHGTGTETKGY